jgi:hypothetical protein
MIDPIAGTIAKQLTSQLVTSARTGAPVRLESASPSRRTPPSRGLRRRAARALAAVAGRLDPAAARAGLAG